MVAGAAALLKAARPGLRSEQYKSLLVNSSSTFTAGGEVPVPLQQGGAGRLDVAAAVKSRLTAVPSTIDFGTGSGTVAVSRTFTLQNIGSTTETYSLTTNNLDVTPNTVELSPGGTAEISVRLGGADLRPQSYEGFLAVRGTQSEVETRIPYWFAVTDSKPTSFTIVKDTDTARPSTTVEFLVRSLDRSGLPLDVTPAVHVVSGGIGARVLSIESLDFRYPGFYGVRVRLSSEAGVNVYEVTAGSLTTQVTITGQ